MRFALEVWRPAGILFALAAIAALLLAGVDQLTQERIKKNDQSRLQMRLNELIPPALYDNDLVEDSITVSDPALGSNKGLRIWRARRVDQPIAVAMTVIAPDGYSGPIRLLVAIDEAGALMGVRTLEHHETPGLGDSIELGRSSWILNFDAKSLDNTDPADWALRKDGGIFDQFSGASITPRAVVSAVHRALMYFKAERESLFTRPSETQ